MDDERTYTTGQMAKAAGISANLMKMWLQRGVISFLGSEQVEGRGRGNFRRFSILDVQHVAIVAELVEKANLAPSRASEIIAELTQSSDGESGFVGSVPMPADHDPMDLVADNLVVTFGPDGNAAAKLVARTGENARAWGERLFLGAEEAPCMVLNLQPIVERVRDALGTTTSARRADDEVTEPETEGGWTGR